MEFGSFNTVFQRADKVGSYIVTTSVRKILLFYQMLSFSFKCTGESGV
jgi:hypothetical protein